jgi:hypothetical protein
MKRRVTYVGGPLCGHTEKWSEDDMVEYLTLAVRGSEFHYRHVLKPVTEGKFRVQHRFLFLGYKPKLPAWLKKEIAKRRKESGYGQ